jgi:hypothetical protein
MNEELPNPEQTIPPVEPIPEFQLSPETPKPKRYKRTGKRKAGFRMDTPPWPVRAIWELASPEDRKRGHELGALMLEHWLGRVSRKDLSEKLNLPPLRVWQMSQQALAGMVVALMKQPKMPVKGTPLPSEEIPREDTKALNKKIEDLQREKQVLADLVDLLKDLPTTKLGKKPGKGEKNTPNPLSDPARALAEEKRSAQG